MYFTSQFELQVRPNGRAAADEYYHEGNTWIEGREGSKYTIWFKNNTNHRVMAIISVDGLDVCKGQPAGPDSDGYLVDPNSSIEIPGWKLDNQTAAEFYFAKIGKSYSHASGANSNNVGVIGVMVFREKLYYASPYTYLGQAGLNSLSWTASGSGIVKDGIVTAGGVTRSAAINNIVPNGGYSTSIACSGVLNSWQESSVVGQNTVGMNTVGQSVGTGFGDATSFNTSQVNFERAHSTVPDAVMVLYYNSFRNLQRMGIQLKSKSTRYNNSTAQAFPGYTTGCTPPPGWTK